MIRIFPILLSLILTSCVQNIYILKEPRRGEMPGAVVFGLFYFTASGDYPFTNSISLSSLDYKDTRFVDLSKGQFEQITFNFESTPLGPKKDGKRFHSAKNILLGDGRDAFYVLSEPEPDHSYALSVIQYSYSVDNSKPNGPPSYRTYYRYAPLDLEQSRKTLEFSLTPGKITYAGIYGVREISDEQNGLGIAGITLYEGRKGILYEGEEILAKSGNTFYQNLFFGTKEMTRAGGEAHFMERFQSIHPPYGYWQNLSK